MEDLDKHSERKRLKSSRIKGYPALRLKVHEMYNDLSKLDRVQQEKYLERMKLVGRIVEAKAGKIR